MQQNEPQTEPAQASACPFRRRPLCLAALGVLLGLLLFSRAGVARAPVVLALLAVLLLAACLLRHRMILLLLFACLSLSSALLQCPRAPAAGEAVLAGRVTEPPEQEGARQTVLIGQALLDGTPVRGRIRLTVYDAPPLRYGDRIAAEVTVSPLRDEYLAAYRYRSIACAAYAHSGTLAAARGEPTLYGRLLEAREAVAARIGALFPDKRDAAVACALLLGGGMAEIDAQTQQQFRAVGIAHLLAVSGLHVSILAGALLVPLRLIPRGRLRFAVLTLLLFGYAALTAFTPSALRASLMLLSVQSAVALERRADALSSLSLAFVVILLFRPFALGNAGFQLSFLAMLGLTLLLPTVRRPLAVIGSRAAGMIGGGLSVVLATVPATARFFGTLPLSSIGANLLVLPIVPFFLIPAAFLLLLSTLSLPAAQALAAAPATALHLLLAVADAGGELSLSLPAPSTLAYLDFLLTLLLLSPSVLLEKKKKLHWSGCAAVLTAFLWALGTK